ncbi:PSPA7_2676 family Cys-rich small protein [Aquipseudomonas campi]
MTFLCLIGGCVWAQATPMHVGNEALLCQRCSRCGANRYLPAEASAALVGGLSS